MIRIDYNWGELQPVWISNASAYARDVLDLHDDDENLWFEKELGMKHSTWEGALGIGGPSIIFENDADLSMAILKWS